VELSARDWPGGLRLVAADPASGVWAVGEGYSNPELHELVTYVLHDGGDGWREVPFPQGNAPSQMSVTDLAVAAGRVWLIGQRGLHVMIFEYDGWSWREHVLPAQCRPGGFHSGVPSYSVFNGIKAFAPDDVWACGYGTWAGFSGPLLLHWDGSAWQPIDVGVDGSGVMFNAMAGRSSSDLWIVGNTPIPGDARVPPAALVVHGDGDSWQLLLGLAPVKLVDVAQDAEGRPWLIHGPPEPTSTFAVFDGSTSTWSHSFAYGPPGAVEMDLHRVTATPDGGTMLAVGAALHPPVPRVRHAAILKLLR
jgi:hypothetical protein